MLERVGGGAGREEEEGTRGGGWEGRVDELRISSLQTAGGLFGDWNATALSGKRVARQEKRWSQTGQVSGRCFFLSVDRGHSDGGVAGGELNGELNSELSDGLRDEFRDELSADGAWPAESELLRYSDESHPTDRADMMETAREKLSRLARALSSSETPF